MNLTPVYIVGSGMFLPGPPIGNDDIEDHLGLINGQRSRTKRRVLASNRIERRHYAVDRDHRLLYTNAEMAKLAVVDALADSPLGLDEIELLATGTTLGDLMAPGHASMVHGELGGPAMEVSSSHGICASSLMALKNAYLQIRVGEKRNAVACGSEFVSRAFLATRFEGQAAVESEGVSFDTDFLRWMLSDGAGAVVLDHKPRAGKKSLRIEFIDLKSHANEHEVCMYLGGHKNAKTGKIGPTWATEPSLFTAARGGLFNLRQDIRMLDELITLSALHFADLATQGRLCPDDISWMLCHYSSHVFREKAVASLGAAGLGLPPARWYTNLYTRGNTGAASIFIMLDEFLRTVDCRPGEQVLCAVPESGRYISSYMLCTVVGPEA